MNIKDYEKPVITKFVPIDGVEFELGALFSSLEQISTTWENDKYGEYSLRDYELYDYETMRKLVEMGLVSNYTGSRMADLYCMKDKKAIEELIDILAEY